MLRLQQRTSGGGEWGQTFYFTRTPIFCEANHIFTKLLYLPLAPPIYSQAPLPKHVRFAPLLRRREDCDGGLARSAFWSSSAPRRVPIRRIIDLFIVVIVVAAQLGPKGKDGVERDRRKMFQRRKQGDRWFLLIENWSDWKYFAG